MASSEPSLPPDKNLGVGIAVVITVLLIIGVIVVALRIATRIWIVKSPGWDDWTIVFALLGAIIGAALDYVEVDYGLGRHQQYLSEHQIQEFRKYGYGEWIQTFATLMWTKVSICLLLLRIPTSRALIRPLQAAIVFLILSNVILTLLWILQCRPVAAAWDKTIQGKCFPKVQKQKVILAQAVISAVSDFAFASYPVLILWKVQMKPKAKVGVCFLMGLGVITGACCVVRTVLNHQSIPDDITFGGITSSYWRSFEVAIGIIAACIPTLPAGYKWLRDALRRSFKHSSTRTDRLPLTKNMRANAALALPSQTYSESPSLMAKNSAHSLPTTQITMKTDLEMRPDLNPHGQPLASKSIMVDRMN